MNTKIVLKSILFTVALAAHISPLSAMNGHNGKIIQAFFAAINSGNLKTVEDSVNGNSDLVNAQDKLKCPALIRSIEAGHDDITLFLIKQRANVNRAHGHDLPPLMKAVSKENVHIIHALVTAGAEHKIKTKLGQTLETILATKSIQVADRLRETIARALVGLPLLSRSNLTSDEEEKEPNLKNAEAEKAASAELPAELP